MVTMSMPDDARRRIDALFAVARRLATATPSGRIVLARVAALLDPSLIPQPARDRVVSELEAALAAASEPLPIDVVEATLREAWGVPPTAELDDLEPVPVATTPTSQVHRGTLDGAPVAVKILRPGLATAVRQDLVVLDGLLAPLADAFPRIEPRALLRETRDRILDELDLEHEAGIQRQVQRALRGNPRLTAPAPVMRLAHERVLVAEWVSGTPLRAIDDPRSRDAAAAQLAMFVFGGFRAGVVDADPDPADALVLADGRLAIVDFGAGCVVPTAAADRALALVEAFADGDGERFGTALEALGLMPTARGPAALDVATRGLGRLGGEAPSRLDSVALLAAAGRLGTRPDQLGELAVAASLRPSELWPLRAVSQLVAAIARVGATAPWRTIVTAALRDGWSAAGELPAATPGGELS
jgi:hypothetical protein